MVEYPFNWQLQRPNIRHEKKNALISKFEINAEWNLVCVWSEHDLYRPELFEIRRNSINKEIMISGTLKLIRGHQNVLQRKFVQLMEAGCATTLVDLEYSTNHNHTAISRSIPAVRDKQHPLLQLIEARRATTPVDLEYSTNRNHPASYAISRSTTAVSYSIVGSLSIPASAGHKDYVKGVQFVSLLDLSKSFECLLDPGATYFSDVNLHCGTVSFPAHKNILSARSPVFATMFTTQMKEKQENKVSITDISPQVVKTMLSYMYTGKTGELSLQTAEELLFAADKYQIQDLKRVCSDYLMSCVSAENVLKILVLGYLHDEDLNVFAMDFICNRSEEFEALEKTVQWKNLREKRPTLAMDVLISLVKSKDRKLKSFN